MNLKMMMIVDTENVFLNLMMMMMKKMDVQDGNSFSSSMPAMYDEDEYMDNHILYGDKSCFI